MATSAIRPGGTMKLAVVLTHWRDGRNPTVEGQARLDLAATSLIRGEVDRILIAGGLPDSKQRTLAADYRKYLMQEGIAEEHIIIEDRSRDTAESLRFVNDLLADGTGGGPRMDELEEIVLISSRRHLRRARHMLGAMKAWKSVPVSFRASQDRTPRADAIKEALFLVYTWIDPEWRSWLAERMRTRRFQHVARSD